jgi:hypothetical protein
MDGTPKISRPPTHPMMSHDPIVRSTDEAFHIDFKIQMQPTLALVSDAVSSRLTSYLMPTPCPLSKEKSMYKVHTGDNCFDLQLGLQQLPKDMCAGASRIPSTTACNLENFIYMTYPVTGRIWLWPDVTALQ